MFYYVTTWWSQMQIAVTSWSLCQCSGMCCWLRQSSVHKITPHESLFWVQIFICMLFEINSSAKWMKIFESTIIIIKVYDQVLHCAKLTDYWLQLFWAHFLTGNRLILHLIFLAAEWINTLLKMRNCYFISPPKTCNVCMQVFSIF